MKVKQNIQGTAYIAQGERELKENSLEKGKESCSWGWGSQIFANISWKSQVVCFIINSILLQEFFT